MSLIVDTGVLYADHDVAASQHGEAEEALERCFDGEFGTLYVSDYIYDESVTLTLRRGNGEAAREIGRKIRGEDPYPEAYEMLHVTPSVFSESVDFFEDYDDHGLSFTDAATLAIARRHEIDDVLSFDDDFDGLVDRMPPGEV